MNSEFKSDQYDAIYASGGRSGIYELPYRHSWNFPLFKRVTQLLKASAATSVLEVGCGTGGLAHMVTEKTRVSYRGFDFSPVAVERARARLKGSQEFFVGDARLPESYAVPAEAIVCTEVLEHIQDDLEVIQNWPWLLSGLLRRHFTPLSNGKAAELELCSVYSWRKRQNEV